LLPLLDKKIRRRQLLLESPRQYEAVIAPGGSLLQNATSLRSLLYYIHVIRRFASAGVPVYMLGQGLGPLRGSIANSHTKKVLRLLKLLSLRDAASYEYARSSMAHNEIHFAADSVLAGRLEASSTRPSEILQSNYCLLVLKSHSTPIETLEGLCQALEQITGNLTQILAFQPGDDFVLSEELSKRTGLGARGNAASGIDLSLIARATMVVSYRLHGLILAAAYGVPALGVAYDPKVSAFCNEMGLPWCTPQDVLDGKATPLAAELWQNREAVKQVMLERRAVALQRLEAAEARFAEMLWGAK
jgi:polysaccharide pyruvyl transferase CsaB